MRLHDRNRVFPFSDQTGFCCGNFCGLIFPDTSAAAFRLTLPKGALANWVSAAMRGTSPKVPPGSRSVSELEAEVTRLRKELAEVRMERDIVKKRQCTLRESRCQVRGHEDLATPLSGHSPVPRLWRLAQRFLRLGERQTVAAGAERRAPEGRHRGGTRTEPADLWPAAHVAGTDNLLNQTFAPPRPNEARVTDITYVATGEGWLYLAGIKDVFTCELVGYVMDERMTQTLTATALWKAVRIDPVDLDHAFSQISANCCNLHFGCPLRNVVELTSPLWHLNAVSERGRPFHYLRR
jgi:transposase-like protein